MTSTPVLALLDFQKQFQVETDACAEGIGAVHMQQGQPIAFLGRALGDKHKHLSIYEKEFLALIVAVEKWQPYLQRQEFQILTDHKSLSYLNEQNLYSEMQRKAMTRLMGLQFKIVYTQGKENIATELLSQLALCSPNAHMMALQAVSLVQPQWVQEVLNLYATDLEATELLSQLALCSPNAQGYSLDKGLIIKGQLI